mmetsp:Transcript_15350/g.25027  ORF Transcript_15350/g.25027 Transcript_15350/m.25027 type:complete len:323 (+) Transcript_15350:50-1018(+)|eukprot:CAMPEP_0203749534 /NCGR_PEP_ID=MMETSP0098-20131031/4061_1 /ASSEMBLY_ACC=CAM_ASM_000208 /TAXON_ID=96639 /ORGANISM=" , Strain NY0313808BC1" /LENGTH=322 /DNA_ID=CAMNT_0050638607 /DNA_START=28 /DNA_END=996 /DNA_ORIENTATION=-
MGKALLGKRKRGHIIRREKSRQAQVVERSKKCLLIRGLKTGFGLDFLRDVKKVRGSEDTILFSKKNDLHPFDDETKVEFLCQKNDIGLFAFASHSKKRPNNMVLGRMFDGNMFDMVELGLSNYVSIQDMLKKNGSMGKTMGAQTAVLFQGDAFDKNSEMESLRSILLDLFKAPLREQVDLTTVDHVVVCTAVGDKVYLRNYVVTYKGKEQKAADGQKAGKAVSIEVGGKKIPDVVLIDMGPSIDMAVRRSRTPAPALAKLALKQAKNVGKAKKVKNVTHDELEGKIGRIHMKKQDMSKLVTRSRFKKALKRGNDQDVQSSQE